MESQASPSQTPRRRRSRSHPKHTLRLALAGAFAVAAVACIFAAQAWIEAYLKSDPFRQQVETVLGQKLSSRVRLHPLRRSGTSLQSDHLEAEAQAGAPYRSLKLHELKAEIDLAGLWSRVWRLEHLSIQSFEADLNSPASDPSAPVPPPTAAPSPTPHPWWMALLPNRSEIGSLRAEHALLRKGLLEARDLRLIATPAGKDWEITAEAGELRLPAFPPLGMTSARAVLRPGEWILRPTRLLGSTGGQASLAGQWNAVEGTALQIQVENFPAQSVLTDRWQSRLKGVLNAELRFRKGPGADAPVSLSGPVRLLSGRLEAFPVLEALGRFLGSPRFQSIPLKKASTTLEYTPSKTVLRDLEIDGDGLLRIQGHITLENDHVNGQLQLGVSPALIQWLPGAQTLLFTDQRDGYVWVPFQISGPLSNPTEDLSARLLGSAKEKALDAFQSVLKTVPVPTLPSAPLPSLIPVPVPSLPALRDATQGALEAVQGALPPKPREK